VAADGQPDRDLRAAGRQQRHGAAGAAAALRWLGPGVLRVAVVVVVV
jgi:hypothetical protein